MVRQTQRSYKSPRREEQARQTRGRILDAARKMILKSGFEEATIEAIAMEAHVAVPTVYAVFRSKRGIVQALMERTAFSAAYENLVREAIKSDDPETRLRFAARIARQIFDSLRNEAEVLRGATAVAPEFIRAKESIRFERQAPLVKLLEKKEALRPEVTPSAARDILWALTGRDLYRMLVLERGWSGSRYEEWLGNTLIAALLKPKT